MKIVLTAIDGEATAKSVLAAGQAIATVLGAEVRALHVAETASDRGALLRIAEDAGVPVAIEHGDPIDEIARALRDPDVLLVAVGARDEPGGAHPAGHVAIGIAERSAKPVLVVPPGALVRDGTDRIERALVPLEGTPESADAMAESMRRLTAGGVELVGVHVLDPGDIPPFWDEPAHAVDAYCAEFREQWCPEPEVELHLRSGAAPATVMEVAESEQVDLIALAWSQRLAPGRALMVRAALATAHVPVLLVPVS